MSFFQLTTGCLRNFGVPGFTGFAIILVAERYLSSLESILNLSLVVKFIIYLIGPYFRQAGVRLPCCSLSLYLDRI